MNKSFKVKTFTSIAISKCAVSLFIMLVFGTSILQAAGMSKEQVIKDVTILAKDDLKGRANFSPEIEQAANYINQRFSDIGLVPLDGLKSYKQTFSITKIQPKLISIKLNGSTIKDSEIAMASTMPSLMWREPSDFTSHIISADDDMRKIIREINQIGGQHLVLLHSSQSEVFGRYRSYFQRGITKLHLEHQGAIVVVLTDVTTIEAIDIKATTSTTTQLLTNIVGVLPGKTKPEEIVLYSAHYDHLGEKPEGDGDLIYNGADDDASGTTAVINLAEYFSKRADNARTLMFSAFAAEEIGGFGSRYFSEQLNPLDVVAMINIEMIGKPSKFGAGTLWMTGMERSNLGTLINAGLKSKEQVIYEDPYPEQGLFYRSDNATLARLGVPAHSFSSTQLDKDKHYHKVSDDISSLDLDSMYKVIETLATATEGLVSGSDTPTRLDASKVRGKGKIY